MATERQIQANRLNAQKSTGPRTPEGKALSSQNAFKSGLDAEAQFVYGETREDFYDLQRDYFHRFHPATPEQSFLVDTLIRNEWLLRRLFRAEAHLWEYGVIRSNISNGTPLGETFARESAIFMRLQRRITLLERSYKEALTDLDRLQSAPQPPQSTPQTPKSASFLKPAPQPAPRPPVPSPESPAPTSPRPLAPSPRPLPEGPQPPAPISPAPSNTTPPPVPGTPAPSPS